ncbi:MAG: hypothetical protein U0U69_13765 [Acidimicrobiia bacterium]
MTLEPLADSMRNAVAEMFQPTVSRLLAPSREAIGANLAPVQAAARREVRPIAERLE